LSYLKAVFKNRISDQLVLFHENILEEDSSGNIINDNNSITSAD